MGINVEIRINRPGTLVRTWGTLSFAHQQMWATRLTAGTGSTWSQSFNALTNQVVGYTYDAAGNLMSDGVHSYSYDAEGNMLSVDGGNTAQYVYDAMNHRVRVQTPSATNEFLFDDAGRRVSTWRVSDNYGSEGRIYWDGQQFAFRDLDGTTYFDHQDWIGTERARTNYQGTVAATFWSLPFGDDSNQTVISSGPYQDNSGFAYLDFDSETLTDHAQYRQYSPAQGRWFSPDPYDGSYDMNNPQSFNRYSYVLNSPVAFNDRSGQDGGGLCAGVGAATAASGIGAPVGIGVCVAGILFDAYELLDSLFGGPSFHGSLQPRPAGSDPGSFGESLGIPTNIPQGNWGIGLALGVPSDACEFGACGTGFQNPVAVGAGAAVCIEAEPCGAIGGLILGAGILYHGYELYKAGKENIRPSWAEKYGLPRPGESGNQFADRVCKAEYGPSGCPGGTGPGSDYNKLKKWADRRGK